MQPEVEEWDRQLNCPHCGERSGVGSGYVLLTQAEHATLAAQLSEVERLQSEVDTLGGQLLDAKDARAASDSRLTDVLVNKLAPLKQELERAYKSTKNQRMRAEKAEAEVEALRTLKADLYVLNGRLKAELAKEREDGDETDDALMDAKSKIDRLKASPPAPSGWQQRIAEQIVAAIDALPQDYSASWQERAVPLVAQILWQHAKDARPQEEPTISKPEHVCGLIGYNGMIDPPCPACEENLRMRTKPQPPTLTDLIGVGERVIEIDEDGIVHVSQEEPTQANSAGLVKLLRGAIDATIQEHGNEVFLGEGYAPDATLIEKLLEALSFSAPVERPLISAILADYSDELDKAACDRCENCGPVTGVMCSFHSVLSMLQGHTWPTALLAPAETQEERADDLDRCAEVEAKRVVRSISAMLGWACVPSQRCLEDDIRALKARAREAQPSPETPAKEQFEDICPRCMTPFAVSGDHVVGSSFCPNCVGLSVFDANPPRQGKEGR